MPVWASIHIHEYLTYCAFRFGGVSFPPMIYFKVFLCNKNGEGVKYITGRRMIRQYPLVSTLSKLWPMATYRHVN